MEAILLTRAYTEPSRKHVLVYYIVDAWRYRLGFRCRHYTSEKKVRVQDLLETNVPGMFGRKWPRIYSPSLKDRLQERSVPVQR